MIDLQFNYPVLPEQVEDLAERLADLSREEAGLDLLRLAPTAADAACRESCGALLGTPADRVILASGGHSAVLASLFAAELSGKALAVEPLTYGALQMQARLLGIRLVACEMDTEGITPESLERICRAEQIAALYTMPTLHNPTTITVPLERRQRIAELAERYGFWIIEDDAYRFLHDDPPPSFLELLPGKTLHVESFSKPLFPALKLAALAAPSRLVDAARDAVRFTTSGPSAASARLVSTMIQDGGLQRTVLAKQVEGARRQAMARGILAGLQVEAHPNSWHLWVHMPHGVRADDASDVMERRGAAVSAARHFAAPGVVAPEYIRLALGAEADVERLADGLRTVAAVLEEMHRAASL